MLRLFVLVLWKTWIFWFCLSIAQSCSTLHDPMDCSKPGFCPSLSPGVCSNSCPLSWWCHPTNLPSAAPFSLCPQSFPASGSFPMLGIKWPKYWNFNFSISPSKEYSGLISFKIDWFGLAVRGSLKSLLHSTVWKHQFFSAQHSLWSNSHIRTCYWKNHSFD